MNHGPHAWDDAYLVSVARQLAWLLPPFWSDILAVDPALSLARLRAPLDRLRAAGLDLPIDGIVDVRIDAALRPAVEALRHAVTRVRDVGAVAFDRPAQWHLRQPCVAAFPMIYFGLTRAQRVPAEVELMQIADRPADDPEWTVRASLVEFVRLRSLALFGNEFDDDDLGIELSELPALEVLDLSGCRLTTLPPAARAVPALRWLSLAGNPLRESPDVRGLPALRFLSLRRTGLGDSDVASLRAQGLQVAL